MESIHRRAARMIYNLPYDMPSADVYRHSNWSTLSYMYKVGVIKLFYKVYSDDAPRPCIILLREQILWCLRPKNEQQDHSTTLQFALP